jgi:regulator of protease activity HflC (stomatin/prohibitin superfamily)
MSSLVAIILLVVFVALAVLVVTQSIRIVPQAMAGIVERFGRYHRTLPAGLNMVTPFADRLRPLLDLREQVVSFPPQPVITRDNLVVGIDTVIYFQVTDARAATYEVANYITAVEQLTVTTLRNVVGGMDLETALTSRDQINSMLRQELDEATGKWGIRVGRVEIKAIEPPGSIQDSMEKQMRADRDKRAAILSAEGSKQSAILTAEGERQAAVLRARGESEAAVLRAGCGRQGAGGAGQGAGGSHQHGVQGHSRGPSGPGPAGLPVPADAAADRPGRREQGLDRAERDRQGAGGARRFLQASAPGPLGSGPGPEFDPAGVGHPGLEGWLTGGGGSVHDGAVGHGESGSVPRAGDAGPAPLHDDPALVQGPAEVRAPV